MKLEAGKRYITRNGFTTGPLVGPIDQEYDGGWFQAARLDNYFSAWFPDGHADFFFDRADNEPYDIVAEAPDA